MDIEITVTCYKCDRPSIALGDGGRPLCARHATLFVTAPRLKRQQALTAAEPSSPDDNQSPSPATEVSIASVLTASRRLIEALDQASNRVDTILEGLSGRPLASATATATAVASIESIAAEANDGADATTTDNTVEPERRAKLYAI